MIRFTTEQTIDRSVEDVWAYTNMEGVAAP
jgi:hypothetical protein